MTNTTYCEPTETWTGSGLKDSKGREIGWIVGMSDNGTEYAAWVQSGRRTAPGEFSDFGPRQRSKSFASQDAASNWAWSTAKERVAEVRAA